MAKNASNELTFTRKTYYNIRVKVGEIMIGIKKLDKLKEHTGGILRTADAMEAGISKDQFYRYIHAENMEKISQGVYLDADAWEDEMYLLQLRFPRIIYSHESALYLHDMAEREPMPLTVTVPSKYNAPALLKKAKVYYVKNDWYLTGICNRTSPDGNVLRVYDKERTVCDIIRKRREIDVSVFNYALNQYVKGKDKDYVRLMKYAKLFHMEKQLRTVMGVLL